MTDSIERRNSVGTFVDTLSRVFRSDSWSNTITGLGLALRDKVKSTVFERSVRLDSQTLEELYHGEDLVAILCDTLPEEIFRKGFDVKITPEDDEDASVASEAEVTTAQLTRELEVLAKYTEAMIWARLYGGSAILPVLQDGSSAEDLSQPLNMDSIKSVESLNVIEGRYMSVKSWYSDPASKNYGLPEVYTINASTLSGGMSRDVHESRLILFDATRVSAARRSLNNGFSDSIVQRSYDTIQQFATGWNSVNHLLADANQAVFKIKGLINMIASENSATITNRMQLVDMCRSVARAIAIDADTESFERQSTNFAGVDKILELNVLRLSSSFRMPATVFFAQSPAGMNATGASDFQWFYDRTASMQVNDAEPKLRKLYTMIFASDDGPTNGVIPENWSIKWRPLMQMTPLEEAQLHSAQAAADASNIDKAIVTPEEVALSRFKPDGYSLDTTIDLDLRRKMMDVESEKALEDLEKKDEPPPVPPAVAPIPPQAPSNPEAPPTEPNAPPVEE